MNLIHIDDFHIIPFEFLGCISATNLRELRVTLNGVHQYG